MNVSQKIKNFKTKHPQGFTELELVELLKEFPNINIEKFNDAMFGNTCIMIENELVNYPWDVELAINCGIENRDISTTEWD